MKGIPFNVKVECTDGPIGRSTYVVVNPVTRKVTHFVVQDKRFRSTERMVPVGWIVESTPDLIRLGCTRKAISELGPFIAHGFSRRQIPRFDQSAYILIPHAVPHETVMESVAVVRVPRGTLPIHRGVRAHAVDGQVGTVDEFLVDARDGQITHLVVRDGRLWNQRDVLVPASEIDRVEKNAIVLRLDRHAVESMPAF